MAGFCGYSKSVGATKTSLALLTWVMSPISMPCFFGVIVATSLDKE